MITEYPSKERIYGYNPTTGESEPIWKDNATGSIVQIEIPHAAIHFGKYFSDTGKLTIANGASFDHLLITPAPGGKLVHLRLFLFAATSAPIYHYLYEDATVSANGTAHSGENFNRNFSSATLGLYHAPTVTTTGTLIHTSGIIGTKQSGGAGETSGTEWVLKQNSKYLSRLTNNSGGSADLIYVIEWYEL